NIIIQIFSGVQKTGYISKPSLGFFIITLMIICCSLLQIQARKNELQPSTVLLPLIYEKDGA
ncbi:hypothetical protein, partial [Phascolarctobacterium succinatutens]|uniref:hypothetical protein n=1 Tax=Phascolarctobacterium succinatutens TaxID=626940 RepID=UPI0025F7D260